MGSDDLSNKVIALTGRASGMGYATAVLLASRGAKVSIADINAAGLESVKAEIEGAAGSAMITQCDIRDSSAVQKWISATVEAWGPLDGVANIGAVIGRQIMRDTVAEIEEEDWDSVIDANLKGLMYCLRAQIPNIKDGGSIVNFASTSGLVGHALNGAYCASKHGVIGLSRCVAREVGPKGIRVNCIAPGPIDTPMLRTSDTMRGEDLSFDMLCLKRIGQPKEVAELVAWLLCDGSSFITGAVNVIDAHAFTGMPAAAPMGMDVPSTTNQRIQFAPLVRSAGPKRPVQTLPIAHVVTHRSSSNVSAPAGAESSVPWSNEKDVDIDEHLMTT